MKRASELIPGSQDTNSQRPYRTHTLVTYRVCIEAEQPLKFNQPREIRTIQVIGHLMKRGLPLSPNQKEKIPKTIEKEKEKIPKTIEKEKEKKKKRKRKEKEKMIKIGISIGISVIIQSESRAQSEGPIKA